MSGTRLDPIVIDPISGRVSLLKGAVTLATAAASIGYSHVKRQFSRYRDPGAAADRLFDRTVGSAASRFVSRSYKSSYTPRSYSNSSRVQFLDRPSRRAYRPSYRRRRHMPSRFNARRYKRSYYIRNRSNFRKFPRRRSVYNYRKTPYYRR